VRKMHYFIQYIICVGGIIAAFRFLDFVFGSSPTGSITDFLILGFVLNWSIDKERNRPPDRY
jgi:F0F1-type ATP synthase assembly protein I